MTELKNISDDLLTLQKYYASLTCSDEMFQASYEDYIKFVEGVDESLSTIKKMVINAVKSNKNKRIFKKDSVELTIVFSADLNKFIALKNNVYLYEFENIETIEKNFEEKEKNLKN